MRNLLVVVILLALAAACAPAPSASFGEPATSLLQAVNQERRSGAMCASDYYPPVAALRLEARLIRTAEAHNTDMVRNSFFSHAGSDGGTVGDRATRQGYAWRVVGENIAWGQRSVAQVVEDWMNSPSHCRAIMSGEFRELGAARQEDTWTLVFGTRR